jgi:hypothetical protein
LRLLDPQNPLDLIPAALATAPDAVVVIPVFAPGAPDATLVLRARTRIRPISPELAAKLAAEDVTTKGNGTRPQIPTHIEIGQVLLAIPADVAKNLRGPVAERHPVYLFTVHRGFYEDAMRQATTGLVVPSTVMPSAPGGGAGIVGGGRIIKP